jgi:L-aspartate oxidase
LLEGLVFGARAAKAMREEAPFSQHTDAQPCVVVVAQSDCSQQLRKLQQTMWEKAGLLRDADALRAAKAELDTLSQAIPQQLNRGLLELRNLQTVGELIVISALAREESRGAHYRNDFPKRNDQHFAKHSIVRKGVVAFEAD